MMRSLNTEYGIRKLRPSPFVIRALSVGIWAAVLLAAIPVVGEGQESVAVTRKGLRFAVTAADVPVETIVRKLSGATGVSIHLDPKLKGLRMTLNLAPRPADRIAWCIARRLGARAQVAYVFRSRSSPSGKASPWAFATDTVELRTDTRIPLDDALSQLGVSARIDPALNADVRVFSPGLPLYRVLDNLAAQVGGEWGVEVAISARAPVDAEAESFERMQSHFSDLARFSPSERQEEIEADLEGALKLAEKDRDRALERMAADIRSLPTLFERIPGEHRGPVAPQFAGILRDYASVLRRSQDKALAPLSVAIHEAVAKLAAVR